VDSRDGSIHGGQEDDAPCECTINANAGLDFWFPVTLSNAIARIATYYPDSGGPSYSLVSSTASYDVKLNLLAAGVSFQYTRTYNTARNSTVDNYIAVTPPPPPAASTVFTTISSIAPNPPNGTFGTVKYQQLFTRAATPTYTVPGQVSLTA
jgi:hypothetical protein